MLRLPLLFLKIFFLAAVDFILRSQSMSWLSGYGTQLPQVVWDVLPISNWENILRISIILFLCGRIGELLMTEELAQLCPFPLWTHQAAVSGSMLPSCAILNMGTLFPLFQMKEQTFGNPFREGLWELKSHSIPCAVVSAFPLCSGCAVTSLGETFIFLAP